MVARQQAYSTKAPTRAKPGLITGKRASAHALNFIRAQSFDASVLVTPQHLTILGDTIGAYLLVLRLRRPVDAAIGRATFALEPGEYFYAGSARGPGGLRARLARHFDPRKTIHWHIDQLTSVAAEITALAVPDGKECDFVDTLMIGGGFEIAAPGFGSSDCRRCQGHLLMPSTKKTQRKAPV